MLSRGLPRFPSYSEPTTGVVLKFQTAGKGSRRERRAAGSRANHGRSRGDAGLLHARRVRGASPAQFIPSSSGDRGHRDSGRGTASDLVRPLCVALMAARTAAGAAAAIRPRSFWAMLNNAERAELTDRSVSQVLMPAVALTLQGDPSDRIYVLLHGFVKATTVVPKTGLEVILRVYGPGDIIGCDFMIPE